MTPAPEPAAPTPLLRVEGLVKRYAGASHPAVNGISFDLEEGGLLALVGESGSGKTTLLRLLAGLEVPDAGTISLDGRIVSSADDVVLPEHRGIGFVFQHHALFPHLDIARNIAFGLSGTSKDEQAETVQSLLSLVGLSGYAHRYPHELSGGERQRVALARALAPKPRLLLLDEPFSSLDTGLRQSMRDETRAVLQARGATAVFVTHDTADALSVADTLAVLRAGSLQQLATPDRVYRAPATRDVAAFLGACSFIPRAALRDAAPFESLRVGPPQSADDHCLWIRPQDLRLASAADFSTALIGTVVSSQYQGSHMDVVLKCLNPSDQTPFNISVWQGTTPDLPVPTVGDRYAIMPR
jgi:iron(III) transport system ATP-binding protein